jgi:hypothetical protein
VQASELHTKVPPKNCPDWDSDRDWHSVLETLRREMVIAKFPYKTSYAVVRPEYGAAPSMADRRPTGRAHSAFTATIPHAYRMHVRREFLILPATSDPEGHWIGCGSDSIEGHWTIDFSPFYLCSSAKNPENEDIKNIGK